MSSRIMLTKLPRIQAPIGHIPRRLKERTYPVVQARLEILRKLVTRLLHRQRIELSYHRAMEARPYAERLIQLAIFRGAQDAYTQEMVDWWLHCDGDIDQQHQLKTMLFDTLTKRFDRNCQKEMNFPPYTNIYRLPDYRTTRGQLIELSVLELKGNEFEPVIPHPPNHEHCLLNVLLRNAANRIQQRDQHEMPSITDS